MSVPSSQVTGPKTEGKESAKTVALQGLEQARRSTELLARFEGILNAAGLRQSDPVGDAEAAAEPSDFSWIITAITRMNRNNANRLGDLLDRLEQEIG